MKVDGYDYAAFCAAVGELHGAACWVRKVLAAREAPLPPGLLDCTGQLDGHHLIPKQVLKREFPHGVIWAGEWIHVNETHSVLEPSWRPYDPRLSYVDLGGLDGARPLAALLNDGRNGEPTCRRHHDLVERALVRIARAELPPQVEEFAAEIGLEWYLEREFGPCPAR